MSDCFILLSAGKSKRFKSKLNKQFITYKNKPLFEHSLKVAIQSKLFKKILIVSNKKIKYKNIEVIKGGAERHLSTQKALNYLKNKKIKNVFIHDAARPNLSINLLKKLKKELKKNKAVVPYLKSENSVKYKIKNKINNLSRNRVLLTQTPQCFNFQEIFNLYKKNKEKITDEASLYLRNNKKIKFILGDKRNIKITTIEDFNYLKSENYYGIGFDIHRLIKNKKLFLGGVKINYHSGLKGHSDGDVILHAIIDALLGAMRKSDIGTLFPSNSNKFKNIRSKNMLTPVLKLINDNNFSIDNIDINLICENPKVSKIRNRILKSLSNLLSINKNLINLKGKTVEKLGIIGKEQAIACEVICSLSK
ncbi:2-C-methyl-D-erythritol 2,4-cyclodiphosphate synthase [Candidatus Pelagibacter sp.]|nr:2-C-methyl-D-erythritol 2,4-cyclodiphosphate synthase [Candidatus Pelagibacter sp.]